MANCIHHTSTEFTEFSNQLDEKLSTIGILFFNAEKYGFKNLAVLRKQANIGASYRTILDMIIKNNYTGYLPCTIVECDITKTVDDVEYEGVRTEKRLGKFGDKVRVRICDTFEDNPELDECNILYKEYIPIENPCLCCDMANFIKSMTNFINS